MLVREWCRLSHVTYQGNLIYQNPRTGELAWECREHLVDLPRQIEAAIRAGQKGDLL